MKLLKPPRGGFLILDLLNYCELRNTCQLSLRGIPWNEMERDDEAIPAVFLLILVEIASSPCLRRGPHNDKSGKFRNSKEFTLFTD